MFDPPPGPKKKQLAEFTQRKYDQLPEAEKQAFADALRGAAQAMAEGADAIVRSDRLAFTKLIQPHVPFLVQLTGGFVVAKVLTTAADLDDAQKRQTEN